MARSKPARESTDREKKWNKVFNALVKMSQNLKNERQFLEQRMKSLHDVIHEMKMEQNVHSLKKELMLGLKEREAFLYKHKFENADNELTDFIEWVGYLSQKCSEPKDIMNDINNKGERQRHKALQSEVKRLKSEMKKSNAEKNSTVSALLAEKNFVWNQYKTMETDLTEQLREKRAEVESANEKIQTLVSRTEELQFSSEKLRVDFAKLKSETVKKNEEISRLSREIKLFKSRSTSATPVLRRCRVESGTSPVKGKNSSGMAVTVKKELDSSKDHGKLTQNKQNARNSTGEKALRKQVTTAKVTSLPSLDFFTHNFMRVKSI
ncbi:spindle apparatus lin-5 [Olea europaea subsp. europaea]|uniref:Spindle apparatus lin-5 n=1 Tax=Olea europaea subsp. europaea TaxID=158383 RepID=A0A8S0Q4G5_OLEEU|nr:spindle apparatus lin-5 [Olea europaea subsp. europaea]